MESRSTTTAVPSEATAPEGPAPVAVAPAVPAIALALAVALAVSMFAPALALFEPTDLPAPFPDQHQRSENLIFIFTLLVALPGAAIAAPRLARRAVVAGNGAALGACSALLIATLAGVGVFVKASERLPWGGGVGTLAAAMVVWWLAAAALLIAATAPERGSRTARALGFAAEREGELWAVAAVAFAVLVLSFTELSLVSVPVLIVGLLLTAAVVVAGGRNWRRSRLHPPGAVGVAIDLLAGGLLFAAVINLVIFTPENPAASIETTIIQFHQNFFLGPANDVLAGDAMLVDSFSQYGIGSIYFLAGWFQLAPIGNGTLGFIDSALSAGAFVGALGICRLAGASRPLAYGAFAVAVVPLVYALDYPLGALLQHGGLRFGMPILLLLAVVVEARWTARPPVRGAMRAVQLLVVGVSAIWALEAWIYTTATVAGLLAAGAILQPTGKRRAWLGRRLLAVLGAWIAAHVLLAGLTLLFVGSLPEWGRYIATLRTFLAGPVGDLTYDFTPFSAALLVMAGYLASAVGLAELWRTRPRLCLRRRIAFVALAGTTAYGIALFSYFVNRSSDHILPYVSLPLVVIGVLWMALLLGEPELAGPRARGLAVGLAAGVGALTVAVAAPSVDTRFEQSGLGLALPGGDGVKPALERLWQPPPLSPAAPQGERLLRREMPGEERSLILTSADLGIEILVGTGRANRLPLADPWEDSLVPDQHREEVTSSVEGLRVGDRMLIDEPAAEVFAALQRDPSRDPIDDPLGAGSIVPIGLATLQQLALKEIGARFSLRPVASAPGGLQVVELVPPDASLRPSAQPG